MKRKKLLLELTEEELVILTAKAYKTMVDLIKNADMYTRAMVDEDIRANAMFADDALQAMEEHIIPAIIETHPTVIAARADIAKTYSEYHKAVIAHHFKRASDLTKCIKKKEKELRITIRNLEQSLC